MRWAGGPLAFVAALGIGACRGGTSPHDRAEAIDPCARADLLHDAANCGACGNVCAPIGVTTFHADGGFARAIAVDSTSVYFSDERTSVVKAPLAGGPPTILASGQDMAVGIAVDGTSVYWTNSAERAANHGDFLPRSGTVMKVSLAGGVPITLASGQDRPQSITVDATNVYWTTLGDESSSEGVESGTVMKVPLGGGTPVTVAANQGVPVSLVVDARSVYWVASGSVMKAPLSGGMPVALTSGKSGAHSVAIDATSVYWMANVHETGAVMKMPLAGGPPITLASGLDGASGIVLDATGVYWTNYAMQSVMKVPIDGGPPVTLASGQQSVTLLAVSRTGLYWSNDGQGVMRYGAEACQSGVCGCPGTDVLCSAANTLPGMVNLCTDTSVDVSNCGACGHPCSAAEECVSGVCQCTQTVCPFTGAAVSSVCVNTSTDPSNCGACDTKCASTEVCVGGVCQCAKTVCSGECVTVATSAQNCGACGHACPLGTKCVSGVCGDCPSGQAVCGGACTGVLADPLNCGSCGVACDAESVCSGGQCWLDGLTCGNEFCHNDGAWPACCTVDTGQCGLDFSTADPKLPFQGCMRATDAPAEPSCPRTIGLFDGCCSEGVCGVRTMTPGNGTFALPPGIQVPVCLAPASGGAEQRCGLSADAGAGGPGP